MKKTLHYLYLKHMVYIKDCKGRNLAKNVSIKIPFAKRLRHPLWMDPGGGLQCRPRTLKVSLEQVSIREGKLQIFHNSERGLKIKTMSFGKQILLLARLQESR